MALDVSKALYSRLTSYTTLTNLVGTKIAPMEAPQTWQLPYVTYQIVSDPPTHAMLRDATIYNPLVQIDAWAETYSNVREIAKQVELRLKDFGGTITVSSTSLVIQRIFYEGQAEIKEVDLETNEVTFRIMAEYRIWHD
jgi:hypothetical protein